MKNEGKQFEDDFKKSCDKTGYCFMRLRDTAKWTKGANTSFTASNPCDGIFLTPPFMWLLEFKSTKGASVSFNPYEPWKKPQGAKTQVMIKANQVKELMELGQKFGVIAGFVINFRPRELKSGTTENKTYFIHIKDFVEFAVSSGKSSIGQKDCEAIGIEIESSKKKVRYNYDVNQFVNEAVVKFINRKLIATDQLNVIRGWLEVICSV